MQRRFHINPSALTRGHFCPWRGLFGIVGGCSGFLCHYRHGGLCPERVCCKIRFQSARVSNKMFEDSPIEGTNIYLPSSAGRSRPRPWLSSHKLGWPFGLANPIGFEVAPSRRAFFFAFVSSHHSSLRRIVWGSPKRMDLPSAFAILAFVRACKGGGGEWREEAQTRLTAAGMARPRGRGGHDHGISFH
jgi:hypothetical protein